MNKSDEWSALIDHERHELAFGDVSIMIEDGVFTPNPEITQTPWMIIENFPALEGKRVADVGTGTGVIAIMAAKQGAEVVATDVSDIEIANAAENIERNGASDRVTLIKTDLLTDVEGDFDYIFANLPIDTNVWEERGVSVTSTLQRFIESVKPKLREGGKIYVPWGSFAEDARTDVEKLFEANSFTFEVATKEANGHTWYLYTLSV